MSAQTLKIAFILLLNLALIACGPIVIRRKRVSIGFGRPGPLFAITLTGIGAIVFGIACLVGGILAFIPTLVYLYSKDDTMLESALTIGVAAAVIIMGGGFVVGALIQASVWLGEIAGSKVKKD